MILLWDEPLVASYSPQDTPTRGESRFPPIASATGREAAARRLLLKYVTGRECGMEVCDDTDCGRVF